MFIIMRAARSREGAPPEREETIHFACEPGKVAAAPGVRLTAVRFVTLGLRLIGFGRDLTQAGKS